MDKNYSDVLVSMYAKREREGKITRQGLLQNDSVHPSKVAQGLLVQGRGKANRVETFSSKDRAPPSSKSTSIT